MAGADRGEICQFGAKRITPRIRALEEEIEGVRQNTDIEHVHRMRVASRRLRATLPLFAGCFEKREYRRWMRSIKAITRALSAARDTDVQIEFLEVHASSHEPAAKNLQGIPFLITTLRKRRELQQAEILAALDSLEQERTLGDLASVLQNLKKKDSRGISRDRSRPVYRAASTRIYPVLEDVISYDATVQDPADITGHHALRIAVKKLRYTLEVYRPLYKNRLRPFLKDLKRVQAILGEIHDCDVWAGILAGGSGSDGLELSLPSGQDLNMLAQDRKERREQLYLELVFLWAVLKKKKIWDNLKKTVDAGI